MVRGYVGALEHRRYLELAGGNLIVTGLGRYTQLEELSFGVEHEAEHSLRDGAEVVVVELLPFGRLGPKKRAARVEQVRAGQEEAAVDQEVLLFGPGIRAHRPWRLMAEKAEHPLGLGCHRLLA